MQRVSLKFSIIEQIQLQTNTIQGMSQTLKKINTTIMTGYAVALVNGGLP